MSNRDAPKIEIVLITGNTLLHVRKSVFLWDKVNNMSGRQ